MEEKDAFSDILLEQESDKKTSKFKKIILFIAIFILIFIIVLVIMRLLNPSEEQTDLNQNSVAKENIKPVNQTKDDPLFKQVPIIKDSSKKESFDELVKKLREKELKKEAEKKAEEAKQNTETKTVAIKKIEQNKKLDEVVKPTPKPKPKKEAKKPKPTPKKTIPTIPTPKNYNSNIYIQVLATSKLEPDTKFINKVKAKKYPYKLFKTQVKGTPYLKILVGPYKSRQDAKSSLGKVRKDLNPKAFIFSTK